MEKDIEFTPEEARTVGVLVPALIRMGEIAVGVTEEPAGVLSYKKESELNGVVIALNLSELDPPTRQVADALLFLLGHRG